MPFYNTGKSQDGNSWVSGDYRCLLATSSYTPNVDHDFVADVAANEATGTGYSRKTFAGKSITVDNANDRVDHDATNMTWTGLTSSFRYLIIFRHVTNDADSVLHSYIDLGAQTVSGSDFTVAWNGGGSSGTVYRGT